MGMMSTDQARRLLGVSLGATADQLRIAYRSALKRAHPDHGGTEEKLRLILEAHQMLTEKPEVSTRRRSANTAPVGNKLTITPVQAVVGGRLETRLPDGRRVAITLPAGLRQGDRIALQGLVCSISIKGRPELFVSGNDICMVVKTTAEVLREGGRLQIKTPMGPRAVWAPRPQPGSNGIIRIAGQGLPPNGRHRQGSLILKLVAEKGPKEERAGSRAKAKTKDWAAA